MRWFCYNDYVTDPSTDHFVRTVSEEEIERDYYPYWREQMIKKYGQEHVDRVYCFQDCVDDWIAVNWAWESTDS